MTTDDPRDPTDPAGGATAPEPAPPAGEPAVPDEDTLSTIATPATVRRAPRIGAFIRVGVLLGAVVGWLLAIPFTGTTGEGRTGAILILTVTGAVFGALLAATVAAVADRRSTRPRRPRRTR